MEISKKDERAIFRILQELFLNVKHDSPKNLILINIAKLEKLLSFNEKED